MPYELCRFESTPTSDLTFSYSWDWNYNWYMVFRDTFWFGDRRTQLVFDSKLVNETNNLFQYMNIQ